MHALNNHWTSKAITVVSLVLTHSCMSFIFLWLFHRFCMPLLFPWSILIFLELTRVVVKTMYTRASETQGMRKVGMEGRETRKEERIGRRCYLFLLDYMRSSFH